MRLIPILLLAASTFVLPAAAKEAGQAPKAAPAADGKAAGGTAKVENEVQYERCMLLARQDPSQGLNEALAWESMGGGEAARHCGAIALVGLRQYDKAARRLEDLAAESQSSAKLRAGMLAQAGQAWLLAGDPERAFAAQTKALNLVPGAPDLLVDRAESLAEQKKYKEALADLDQALAAAPNRVDALTFRGTAKRFLDDRKGAEIDIAKALSIDPNYQDAWLESGILKRLAGNDVEARQAWSKVLEIAPHSAAADSARRDIELLDGKSR